MANHAVNIRQLSSSSGASARVLAVTSGKGGVGKTNIAANLALCLAASKKRVLLWDADISLGNLDLVMNIQSRYNISHVVNGYKRVGWFELGYDMNQFTFGLNTYRDLGFNIFLGFVRISYLTKKYRR